MPVLLGDTRRGADRRGCAEQAAPRCFPGKDTGQRIEIRTVHCRRRSDTRYAFRASQIGNQRARFARMGTLNTLNARIDKKV
jgi:hypothetical protein